MKRLLSVQALILLPSLLFAAETNERPPAPLDLAAIGLTCLMVVLMLGVCILANAVKHLAFVFRDKMREDRSKGIAAKSLLMLIVALSAATTALAAEPAAAGAVNASIFDNLGSPQYYVLGGIIAFELLIMLVLILIIRMMIALIVSKTELLKSADAQAAIARVKQIPFWDRFNKAVVIEKEEDIMLDHDYDGIRELDNTLPPWWKYGFYLTIVVSVVYLWYYHAGGNGPSSHDEYVSEVQAGEEAKAAFLAQSANNVDENTVTMGDASAIDAGKAIFESTCAACHARDGGGGVGPNLTDAYWLHGGGLKEVFKSVKYGWPDKGMKSWKDDFSPKQIASIASYIISIRGSKPAAPKDKQGELYTGEDSGATPRDSTKKVALN